MKLGLLAVCTLILTLHTSQLLHITAIEFSFFLLFCCSESLPCRSSQGREPAKPQSRSLRLRCDASEAQSASQSDSLQASALSRRQAIVRGLVAGYAVPLIFGLPSANAEPTGMTFYDSVLLIVLVI